LPEVQSVSDPQLVLQAFVPQMYAPQLTVPGLAQVPVPEQNAGGVKVVPLHEGFPH
jgi:hypothetical protein